MENIVAVFILVVGGVLLAVVVSAICGKRKLHRHKECSKKDPHVPGAETSKALRVEIERRLQRVSEIKCDPLLLSPDLPAPKHEQEQFYYRMKALDHVRYLEQELIRLPGVTPRASHETIRGFLLRLAAGAGGATSTPGCFGAVLRGVESRLLHQLCDYHSHARFHAQPFTRHHLTQTHALMLRVLHSARARGAKQIASEDELHLKAPSDHDSAIDADPIELDISDDERSFRNVIPHYQSSQQPHRVLTPRSFGVKQQQQCLTGVSDRQEEQIPIAEMILPSVTTSESSPAQIVNTRFTSKPISDRNTVTINIGSISSGSGTTSKPKLQQQSSVSSYFSTYTFPPAPSKTSGAAAAVTAASATIGHVVSRHKKQLAQQQQQLSANKLRKSRRKPGHLRMQDEDDESL